MDFIHFNYIKSASTSRFFRVLVTGAALLCFNSWAALGGNTDTVLQDQRALSASGSAKPIAGATLHTQLLPGGVTVRQYVDPAGQVFAVAWEGPVQPDFERLLGPHFAAYQAALQQQRRGVVVRNADLVLESGGRMRAFVGRAYLPSKVPAALDVQAIR